jgi:hypothetical protein
MAEEGPSSTEEAYGSGGDEGVSKKRPMAKLSSKRRTLIST